jgi:hypothetical protein
MATLTRRLQILLDEERYRQLERESQRSGRSIAALIRVAVDRAYGHDVGERHAAVQRFLDAPLAPVADWSEEKRLIRERSDRP